MDSTLSPGLPDWPRSPQIYGWLSLDRRGRWRLRDEVVHHPGLIAFLSQHYRLDDDGRAYVQNGPQQVFVRLEYTPWVYRLQLDGRVCSHADERTHAIEACWLDDEGNLLIKAAPGIGVLDDRDLGAFIGQCQGLDENTPDNLRLVWQGLPVQPITRAEAPARFGFCTDPQAAD